MKKSKADRLRAAGWEVGTVREFFGLTDEEAKLIELKLGIADFLRQECRRRKLTQTDLAGRIGSNQSCVAKIEAGDASVSLDLMFRTAFSLGVTMPTLAKQIARIEQGRHSSRKAG